jgi:hypothetical protein
MTSLPMNRGTGETPWQRVLRTRRTAEVMRRAADDAYGTAAAAIEEYERAEAFAGICEAEAERAERAAGLMDGAA